MKVAGRLAYANSYRASCSDTIDACAYHDAVGRDLRLMTVRRVQPRPSRSEAAFRFSNATSLLLKSPATVRTTQDQRTGCN